MDQTAQKVKAALAASVSPAVLWSGGKDSMLLLDLVREQRPNVPVIWFRTGTPEHFAKRIIRDWHLMAFSWAPTEVYLLRQNGNVAMVHEYGIGGVRLPVLIDLKPGKPCKAATFTARTPSLFLPFDTLFVGWKDSDNDFRWARGNTALPADGFKLGRSVVMAPLRHMSDEAVRSAVIDREIPYEPVDDELAICDSCLAGDFCEDTGEPIPVTLPIDHFRHRFNLEN